MSTEVRRGAWGAGAGHLGVARHYRHTVHLYVYGIVMFLYDENVYGYVQGSKSISMFMYMCSYMCSCMCIAQTINHNNHTHSSHHTIIIDSVNPHDAVIRSQ